MHGENVSRKSCALGEFRSETETVGQVDTNIIPVSRECLESQYEEFIKTGMILAQAVNRLAPWKRYSPNMPSAYAVGGFVRDMMLGLRSKDMDVEVYGVNLGRLKKLLEELFGQVNEVGKSYSILKVRMGHGLEMDVSTPRREKKIGKGHKGFDVDSDPSLSVFEAAKRRDFAINAMSYDFLNGTIFDPFGGLKDLENRILRIHDPKRFQEDPLRIMRAAQFTGRFEFVVEPDSFALMKMMVERGDLIELPRERITEEWIKILLKSSRPSIGLELLRALGAIEKHFPELNSLIGVEQEKDSHPEGDVWRHTMMVVDQASKIIRSREFSQEEKETVMFGALFHDIGKPAVTKIINGRIRSFGHEEAGEQPAKIFLARLALSKEIESGIVKSVVEHKSLPFLYDDYKKGQLDEKSYANAVRRLLKRIAPMSWRVLLAVCEADTRGNALLGSDTNPYLAGEKMAEVIEKAGLDEAPTRPLIQGRDVLALIESRGENRKPDRWVGNAIRYIEAKRDAGEIVTREEALEMLRKMEL